MPPKGGKEKTKKADLGPSLEERYAKVRSAFNSGCRSLGVSPQGHCQEQLAACYAEGSSKLILSEVVELPIFRALFDALLVDDLVNQLCFWRAGLGDEGAVYLGAFLSKRCITHLDLLDNNIGVKGAAALAQVMEKGRKVQTLVLDHNPLTEVGIRVMCGAMRANFDLKSLSLMYCRIGPAGGKIIADTLIANSRVAELQLKGNQLEGEGILAISQALRRNKFLESLDLSDNCLRDMYGNEEKKRKEKEKTDKEGTSSSPSTPSAMSTNGASSPRSESEMSRSALNTAETGVDGDVDSLRDSTSAPSNVLAIDGNMVTIGASNDALAEGTVKALLTEDSNGVASSPLKKDTVAMLSIAVMLKHNTTLKKLNLSFNLIGHKSAQILKDTITSAKATSNLAEFIVTERLDSKLFQDLVKFESAKKGKKGAGGKKKKKK